MFSVDLPYPKVNVKDKNPKYIDLILLNFSSSTSEFSAINQYTYHEISYIYKNPEISKILKEISIVEMYHLKLLGEILVQLGSQPGYWIDNKKKNYWSSKLIDYDLSSLKHILEIDINSEKEAIKQYKETICKIQDENINNILKRIILDEEIHIQLFLSLYKKYVT